MDDPQFQLLHHKHFIQISEIFCLSENGKLYKNGNFSNLAVLKLFPQSSPWFSIMFQLCLKFPS
jgi:hypothetical protein